MKDGEMRQGTFAPFFKGNYPYCLQEVIGKSIEWRYMGKSTTPPTGVGLYMALTDNMTLRDPKYWVYENTIDFDTHVEKTS